MKEVHNLFKEFRPSDNVRIGVGNCIELTSNSNDQFPDCMIINHPSKRLQCRAARCLLNLMLEQDAVIEYDQFSAPLIKNSNLQISISHSEDYVAIAISKLPVGIDIQVQQEKILKIADKFVKKDEPRPLDKEALINWLHWQWSAKESLFKIYKKGNIDFKSMLKINPLPDVDELQFDSKGTIDMTNFQREYMLHFVKLEDYYLVCAF
jgi:4'-phosphopantetheinyl transferase